MHVTASSLRRRASAEAIGRPVRRVIEHHRIGASTGAQVDANNEDSQPPNAIEQCPVIDFLRCG